MQLGEPVLAAKRISLGRPARFGDDTQVPLKDELGRVVGLSAWRLT